MSAIRTTIAGIAIPDSVLAREATEFVRQASTPLLFDPNLRTPFVNQWNLSVQRQLMKDTIIEVAYVGNKGTHMFRMMNANQATRDIGLLLLRVGAGAMLFLGHGWGKITHFSERAGQFADPIHLGSGPSFTLVVFAEKVLPLAQITSYAIGVALVILGVAVSVAAV